MEDVRFDSKMLNSVTFISTEHLNVGQAFLQAGNNFRELGSVLKWEEGVFISEALHIAAHLILLPSLKRRITASK